MSIKSIFKRKEHKKRITISDVTYPFFVQFLIHIREHIEKVNNNEKMSKISINIRNHNVIENETANDQIQEDTNHLRSYTSLGGKFNLTSLESLKLFKKSNKMTYLKIKILEELQFSILNFIFNNKDEDILEEFMYYHAVIHLLILMNKKEKNFFEKINEWLNTNYVNDDIRIEATRGNFGRITAKYEYLEESLDQLSSLLHNENLKKSESDNIFLKIGMSNELTIDNHKEKIICKNCLESFLIKETVSNDTFLERIKHVFRKKVTNKEIIQEKCEHLTIFQQKYDEWKTENKNILPNEIKDILFGQIKEDDLFWADELCYNLLYVNKFCGEMANDRTIIKNLIEVDNIFANILKGENNEAFHKCNKFLKLIFIFGCPDDDFLEQLDISDLEKTFEMIAIQLYSIDWKLSLNFMAFSSNLSEYFDSILEKVNGNYSQIEDLIEFSIQNRIYSEKTIEYALNILKTGKQYFECLNIANKYKIKLTLENEFIEFCIKNFRCLEESYITKNILNEDDYEFISYYGNITTKNINDSKNINDICLNLLKNKHSINFSKEILEAILKIESVEEIVLTKSLDFVTCLIYNDSLSSDKNILQNLKMEIFKTLQTKNSIK